MNLRTTLPTNRLPLLYISISLGMFILLFGMYHRSVGNVMAALAILPITIGSWYYGIRGGAITSVVSILSVLALRYETGDSIAKIVDSPSTLIGSLALLFIGVIFGRFAAVSRERRTAFIRLEHSNKLTYSLLHVTTHMERTLNPDEIAESLSSELLKVNIAHTLALYDKHQGIFRFDHTSLGEEVLDRIESELGFPLGANIITVEQLTPAGSAEKLFEPVVVTDPGNELHILFQSSRPGKLSELLGIIGIRHETTVFRLPLVLEENLIGILWLWGKGIVEADLPVLSIFAKQVAITLERARLFQEVQDLALTDPLTSLPNRRSLFEVGRIEFSRATRLHRPFCCLMIDLDHFKQVNDLHGHPFGDKALQEFARRCWNSIREIDLIGRYGGEELIVLMPETSVDTAMHAAERIRAAIADERIMIDEKVVNLTVSIGIAAKDENTPDLETLIARADQAMYMAKHKGRNRVAIGK